MLYGKRRKTLVAAAALALSGSSALSPVAAQAPQGRLCTGDEALRTDIERFASELYGMVYPERVAPGIAIAVIRPDCDVLIRSYGYADLAGRRRIDENTSFYIASSTKAFTALSMELLHARGIIDLDAPISRYAPRLRLAPPLDPDRITLRQLLTHTHGIENWGPVVFRTALTGEWNRRDLMRLLERHPPAASGTAFEYGNIGYNAAGLVIENATSRTWQSWLETLVLRPLDLRMTTPYASNVQRDRIALPYMYDGHEAYTRLWQAKRDANMHAAGGLFSSLRDLTIWLRAVMGNGSIGGRQVFPASAVEEARREQARRPEPTRDLFSIQGYGLGWDQGSHRGHRVLQSQGGFSAYQTLVTYMPDRNIGIVVLTNESVSGSDMMRAIAEYAYDMAVEAPGAREMWASRMQQLPRIIARSRERIAADLARQAERPNPPAAALRDYAGTFRNPDWGTFRVAVHHGRLQISAGALRSNVEPYNAAERQWRVELIPGLGETIKFGGGEGRSETLEYAGVTFNRVH